ncbi:MAG: CDP-diacylglycerol--glycerol-3-phosphate 3-phosphatidyltransferase [Clostridia bacterium]|nr:CDP-diacylglycerol--glycerol-3-phosphate 3-phosphatidyltransferase [Clostridia bacterium]
MNLPNKISIVRIVLIPVMTVVYLLNFNYAALWATNIFIIAALTDFLDGYIARKYNMVTDLGKLLDPIADKLLVLFALFLIAYDCPLSPSWICAVFGAIIIARELLISIVRQIAASKNVIIHANIYGKAKTFVQDIAIPLLFLTKFFFILKTTMSSTLYTTIYNVVYYAGYIMITIATILTIISGIVYLVQNKSVFKQE